MHTPNCLAHTFGVDLKLINAEPSPRQLLQLDIPPLDIAAAGKELRQFPRSIVALSDGAKPVMQKPKPAQTSFRRVSTVNLFTC